MEKDAGKAPGLVHFKLQVMRCSNIGMKVIYPQAVKAKVYVDLKPKLKYFSEIWILPSGTLFAVLVYVFIAFVFYSQDG